MYIRASIGASSAFDCANLLKEPVKMLVSFIFGLFPILGSCSRTVSRRASLPPQYTYQIIGNSSSTFPNVYRDGGGGGQINGLNFVVFADGTETTGGYPLDDGSNFAGFESNSIVYSEYNGGGPQNFMDFGSNNIPKLFVPFTSDEDPNKTGIWPNSNIATLCGGHCGVAFYPVINRTACPACTNLYGTGVNITVGAYGPSATRPVKALFQPDEVNYGLFSSLLGIDGYLYMFGAITSTNANGLKMARVPSGNPFDRSTYQYWNGNSWVTTVTPYDDGGKANIFNYSTTDLNGNKDGPDSGDLFYSSYYGVYMLIFQAIGIDPTVYMSYSSSLLGGWSNPVSLFQTPTLPNGYNYNIHAYPAYDQTQRVIPISWTQFCTCE